MFQTACIAYRPSQQKNGSDNVIFQNNYQLASAVAQLIFFYSSSLNLLGSLLARK